MEELFNRELNIGSCVPKEFIKGWQTNHGIHFRLQTE
jgi:hypothetical protein